jgi:hypothetical protein
MYNSNMLDYFIGTPVSLQNTKNRLKIWLLWLIFFILIINTLALLFYWYSTIWWFDIFMHFMGGVFVSFLTLFLFSYTKLGDRERKETYYDYFLIAFSGVIAIGILWEMYEIFADMLFSHNQINSLDIFADLLNDVSGAIFAYIIFARVYLSPYIKI